MKKPLALVLWLCVAALLLAGCAGQGTPTGSYTALNPPVQSGETVIQQLTFDGEQVTLISGEVRQTVDYKINGDVFTLQTDYGDFDYAFEQKDDGSLIIDSVTYQQDQ